MTKTPDPNQLSLSAQGNPGMEKPITPPVSHDVLVSLGEAGLSVTDVKDAIGSDKRIITTDPRDQEAADEMLVRHLAAERAGTKPKTGLAEQKEHLARTRHEKRIIHPEDKG